MPASASELMKAGRVPELVSLPGLSKEIEVLGLTIHQAMKFSKFVEKNNDPMLHRALLIKECCPAFRRFWWTPERIQKKIAANILIALSDKVMELSGYTKDSVDKAAKP